jgi:hypothetical protein
MITDDRPHISDQRSAITDHILDFSIISRHEPDNHAARDGYDSCDDYFPEKGAGRRNASFNVHWHGSGAGGCGRPMALDGDWCAEIDQW